MTFTSILALLCIAISPLIVAPVGAAFCIWCADYTQIEEKTTTKVNATKVTVLVGVALSLVLFLAGIYSPTVYVRDHAIGEYNEAVQVWEENGGFVSQRLLGRSLRLLVSTNGYIEKELLPVPGTRTSYYWTKPRWSVNATYVEYPLQIMQQGAANVPIIEDDAGLSWFSANPDTPTHRDFFATNQKATVSTPYMFKEKDKKNYVNLIICELSSSSSLHDTTAALCLGKDDQLPPPDASVSMLSTILETSGYETRVWDKPKEECVGEYNANDDQNNRLRRRLSHLSSSSSSAPKEPTCSQYYGIDQFPVCLTVKPTNNNEGALEFSTKFKGKFCNNGGNFSSFAPMVTQNSLARFQEDHENAQISVTLRDEADPVVVGEFLRLSKIGQTAQVAAAPGLVLFIGCVVLFLATIKSRKSCGVIVTDDLPFGSTGSGGNNSLFPQSTK